MFRPSSAFLISFNYWKDYVRTNKKFRQVSLLYSVNIVSIPLSIFTSIVLTRFLGPIGYGDYAFLNQIFNFAMIVFTFGFFQAANRALVLNNDKEKAREYFGAALVVLLLLFIFMVSVLLIYGIFDANIASKGVKQTFFIILPFSWLFLLKRYFETLFQADNKIKELAATRLLPVLGFFLTALIVYLLLQDYSGNKVQLIWVLYLSVFVISYLLILKKIKVSFRNLKKRLGALWSYNKSFGFDVYTGSIFAVGFSALTGVLISYFSIDNSGVGFYGLALTFASPLMLVPNVIATTHYKDFASKNEIPRKLMIATIGLSLLSLVFILLVVPLFIKHFYGPQFLPVIRLNMIVSIGVIFHGLADFINRFLGAHGKGKILRNSSFIIGGMLMTLNLTLVPLYGETGAVITKVFTGAIYFGLMIFFYRKLSEELKSMN